MLADVLEQDENVRVVELVVVDVAKEEIRNDEESNQDLKQDDGCDPLVKLETFVTSAGCRRGSL